MVSSIQTPILMYHSVADRAPAGFGRFVVSPARFTQQMQLLRDSGYDGLSVRDYIRKSRDGSLKYRTVVLTFDDGFSDFGSAVLPVLAGLDFTATLYIVSGLVGKTSMWLPDSGGFARVHVAYRFWRSHRRFRLFFREGAFPGAYWTRRRKPCSRRGLTCGRRRHVLLRFG